MKNWYSISLVNNFLNGKNRVDIFLQVGVPDWRLNQLPNLYEELLSQREMLTADGLSAIEINTLENLLCAVGSFIYEASAIFFHHSFIKK